MTTKIRRWTAQEYLNLAVKCGACEPAVKLMRQYIKQHPRATAVQMIRWLHGSRDRMQTQGLWPLYKMVDGGGEIVDRICDDYPDLESYMLRCKAYTDAVCACFDEVLPEELED